MSIESRLREGLARNSESVPVDVETSLDRVSRRTAVSSRRRIVVLAAAAAAGVAVLLPPAVQRMDDDSTPATPTARELVGTYVVEVPTSRPKISGRWTVTVAPDGRLVLDPPPGLEDRTDTASYVVRDGVLETNAFVNTDCQAIGSSVVGKYTWTHRGELVLFTLVEDDCSARRALFEPAWEQAP